MSNNATKLSAIEQEVLEAVRSVLRKYVTPDKPELIATAEEQLSNFKEADSNYKFTLGELNGYIHILRNGNEIGCFCTKRDGIKFEFQNDHPLGRAHTLDGKPTRIPINELTKDHIKSAIEETP